MLPTWVVSLLQAGRIACYTAIIETPVTPMPKAGRCQFAGGDVDPNPP